MHTNARIISNTPIMVRLTLLASGLIDYYVSSTKLNRFQSSYLYSII